MNPEYSNELNKNNYNDEGNFLLEKLNKIKGYLSKSPKNSINTSIIYINNNTSVCILF